MIPIARIDQIAAEVAVANLQQSSVATVSSEPSSDSEGQAALRITIIMNPGVASKLEGNQLLDTLSQIQERLQREGEERFAIVEYATEEELQTGGDT